jgi:hypothetical protein
MLIAPQAAPAANIGTTKKRRAGIAKLDKRQRVFIFTFPVVDFSE